MKRNTVRVKHTPNCLHPYTASITGEPIYGWGNSPTEARECLTRRLKERKEICAAAKNQQSTGNRDAR